MDDPNVDMSKDLRLRDQYLKRRDEVMAKIAENRATIKAIQIEITGLEKVLEDERPKLEGARLVCKNCDILSMKYDHTVPGQGEREMWYKCSLCGYSNYTT